MPSASEMMANALKTVQDQWHEGEPYRVAVGALMSGDPQTAAKVLNDRFAGTTKKDIYEGAMNTGLGMAPMGLGHTVYHGSPYNFDKFDLAKIGTGEGAQAYGHGLYLAEHPDVAKGYQNKLTSAPKLFEGNNEITDIPDKAIAAQILLDSGGDKSKATQKLISMGASPDNPYSKGWIDALNNLDASNVRLVHDSGALYKTDIPDAHIDKMLDWDKPLSEQHPDVQAALQSFGLGSTKHVDDMNDTELLGALGQFTNTLGVGEKTGAGLYKELQNHFGSDSAASQAMQQAGIPGIKYLDQGSRANSEGTSNFVMFNPEDIRILEKNGQPTGQVPWNSDSINNAANAIKQKYGVTP